MGIILIYNKIMIFMTVIGSLALVAISACWIFRQ